MHGFGKKRPLNDKHATNKSRLKIAELAKKENVKMLNANRNIPRFLSAKTAIF